MIKPKSHLRSAGSTTLVECLCAMTILTIGMLASYLAYGQCIRVTNSMWNTSRVHSAIRQEMEYVRILSWSAVSNIVIQGATSFATSATNVLADVPGATGEVDAEWYPNSTNASTIAKVTVRVDWTDLNNVNRHDSAVTLVGNNGLNTTTQ